MHSDAFLFFFQNMQVMESRNKGTTVLSGILYRMQCVKISRLIAERSRGRGGQAWVIHFYKNVFEKKKGFYHYTAQEKQKKWKEDKVVEEFEEGKKAHRWLVQSRNRLLRLYDMVSHHPFFFFFFFDMNGTHDSWE
jgi:hypothetical protein